MTPNKPNKSTSKGANSDKNEPIRLNKWIANSGICSRRDADQMILDGKIKVNNVVVTQLGTKVTNKDQVTFGNKILSLKKEFVYILLNKPKGFLSTTEDDRERKTIMEIIKDATKERVYPVGRLDKNSTGLILLTNDGDLTNDLIHPSKGVSKVYSVGLDKPLHKNDMIAIMDGKVELEDGNVEFDKIAYTSEDKTELGIELHTGRNRIIRRTFEKLGYDVKKLDRVGFGMLTKRELPRGKWRILSEKEIRFLKYRIS
jgi:23S rRNA pseudouridine2605 synthase